MIRLLLAEDQRLLRQALVEIFEREPDLTVVAQCSTAAEIVPTLAAHDVDVAVMDIEYPDGLSLDVLDRVVELASLGVVLVTVFDRPGYVARAVAHKSVSFVLKDSPPKALVDVIRRTADGQSVVDPKLAVAALRDGPSPLTPRETQVLRLSRTVHATNEIAAQLHLSPGTVRNTLSSAIQKLHASSRTEAALVAESKGWI